MISNFFSAATHTRDSLMHPNEMIRFLVGVRGKNEVLAIGGPWSPSLDGDDPAGDPMVLVRTAIRCCKALTGIDLSGCTKWSRFVQVHYRRQETSTKPAATETTVIFLPDVCNVMPSKEDYRVLANLYSEAVEAKVSPKKAVVEAEEPRPKVEDVEESKADPEAAATSGEVDQGQDDQPMDVGSSGPSEEAVLKEETVVKASGNSKEANEEEDEALKAEDDPMEDGGTANSSPEKDEAQKQQQPTPPQDPLRPPKHWKELDVKVMKVSELREELEARGLGSKGLKSQLIGRLLKELKQEQDKEQQTTSDDPDEANESPGQETKPKVDDVSADNQGGADDHAEKMAGEAAADEDHMEVKSETTTIKEEAEVAAVETVPEGDKEQSGCKEEVQQQDKGDESKVKSDDGNDSVCSVKDDKEAEEVMDEKAKKALQDAYKVPGELLISVLKVNTN